MFGPKQKQRGIGRIQLIAIVLMIGTYFLVFHGVSEIHEDATTAKQQADAVKNKQRIARELQRLASKQ